MPKRTDPHTELTPEAVEVLNGIVEDTRALQELDLGDAPPAATFEAMG